MRIHRARAQDCRNPTPATGEVLRQRRMRRRLPRRQRPQLPERTNTAGIALSLHPGGRSGDGAGQVQSEPPPARRRRCCCCCCSRDSLRFVRLLNATAHSECGSRILP
ncbi:hypothetical protein HPB50_019201 [Hyalomma asiaticum]|uniref:Uncharacterized protein n=1 Tax=Hyalomma asiaticum TaxID=266040 RepID=A0ACB7TKQ5_HYAAI|nr:hypothetical protein HPB50_019201 [Hyalomma asiaticum]